MADKKNAGQESMWSVPEVRIQSKLHPDQVDIFAAIAEAEQDTDAA